MTQQNASSDSESTGDTAGANTRSSAENPDMDTQDSAADGQRTIALVYRPGSPLRSRYEQLAEAIKTHMQGYLDRSLKQAV